MQKHLDPDTDPDPDRSAPSSMRPVPAAANLAGPSTPFWTAHHCVAKAGFRTRLHRHIATMQRLTSSLKTSSAGDLRQSCPDGSRPRRVSPPNERPEASRVTIATFIAQHGDNPTPLHPENPLIQL